MSNSSGIVSSVGPGAAALKGVLKLAGSNRIFKMGDV